MFDPFLRAIKRSQLLFVSLLISSSSLVYADDSGPLVIDEPESLTQSLESQTDVTDETLNLTELVPVASELDSSLETQAAGPELELATEGEKTEMTEVEKEPLVAQEDAKVSTQVQDTQPLGPVITTPEAASKTSNSPSTPLLPSYPNIKLTGAEDESLDFLWQKTFPTLKHSEPKSIQLVEQNETVSKPEETSVIDDRPSITIIIDDLGYNRRGMEESLSLPVEVALAILPHTPFSKKTALAATEQTRNIILHVPMENERELKLGPGGLYKSMGEKELKETLKAGIESVPGIQGINNHMGSLLTQDTQRMEWVMEVIQPMELFFIDSLTSPNSVALANALKFNLTTTRRDVFLDNIQDEKAIDRQFKRLLAIAKKRGKALAIGHPYPATMNYLSKRLAKLDDDGIRLISIAEYIE
ncbi:divergent polysaccharide deacetylase family protein [Marinomonas sp. PE14-40]|uniref:divergent polysaccharide deacetylase family protein n=1 Tax=Marinomonas sp. PE14-40 TaxID=3060621 RepID=UPI003F6653EB